MKLPLVFLMVFFAVESLWLVAAREENKVPQSVNQDEVGVFFAQIRQGDISAIKNSKASLFQSQDVDGNTPLMRAAFYLDAETLELFLKNGADPNATNKTGATALMWAVSDLQKVRVLLQRGAKANALAGGGITPLIIACHQYGSADVLKELIAHGADLRVGGANPVLAAARTGDPEALRVLLAHGGEVNSTGRTPYSATAEVSALMTAVHFGHLDCVNLLLEHGADVQFTSEWGNALHFATFTDRKEIARLLIEKGVNVNTTGKRIVSNRRDTGLTPLMYAAMSERNDPTLVQWLINRGADVNARTPSGETALLLAQQRGETKIVAALRDAGAKPVAATTGTRNLSPLWQPAEVAQPNSDIFRRAVENGLALLLKSGAKFTEETANRCFSCHQQSQPTLALGLASAKGFSYDKAAALEQLNATLRTAKRRRDGALEEPQAVPSIAAWFLIGLHAAGHPPDEVTDGYAYSLARSQYRDGRWITKAARAPMDYSDVTSTALSIRALKLYAPPTMKKGFDARIANAARWLRAYSPSSTEERALQILGLAWAGNQPGELTSLVGALLMEQRDDGGWAQLPTLQSDAYATGLVLYASNQAGAAAPSHPAYQRGAKFLLKEQLSDGSWFVPTRASAVQVAVDDIFPHGKDQWISSAATSWATMALTLAAEGVE